MSMFESDYSWQLQFLPKVKQIVGPLLLGQAPFDLDRAECTDLLVLRAKDMRIGCRVRRSGYYERYPNEFTIRSRRDTGASTELEKIVNGWGDWLFYGHAPDLLHWLLVDLHAFRAQLIRNKDELKRGHKTNGDGTYFAWFDVGSFRPDPAICIAQSVL